MVSLAGVDDSAIRLNVAVCLWIATLVALGAAAICEKLEQAATAPAKDRAERKSKRDKIMAALAAAEDRSLQSASKDDLLKQLAALDD